MSNHTEKKIYKNIFLDQPFFILVDTILGNIYFPNSFKRIVYGREFQMLKYKPQHGFVESALNLSCPIITRMQHSISTYYFSMQCLYHLKKNCRLNISKIECVTFLLACLMHDLTHGPYSHTHERINNKTHEEALILLIQNELYEKINGIYAEEGYAKKDGTELLLNFLKGEDFSSENLEMLHKLFNGTLDCDKFAYFTSDYFAFKGVNISSIIKKVISGIKIVKQGKKLNIYYGKEVIDDIKQLFVLNMYLYKNYFYNPLVSAVEEIYVKYTKANSHVYGLPGYNDLDSEEEKLLHSARDSKNKVNAHLAALCIEGIKQNGEVLIKVFSSDEEKEFFKIQLEKILGGKTEAILTFKRIRTAYNEEKNPVYILDEEKVKLLSECSEIPKLYQQRFYTILFDVTLSKIVYGELDERTKKRIKEIF